MLAQGGNKIGTCRLALGTSSNPFISWILNWNVAKINKFFLIPKIIPKKIPPPLLTTSDKCQPSAERQETSAPLLRITEFNDPARGRIMLAGGWSEAETLRNSANIRHPKIRPRQGSHYVSRGLQRSGNPPEQRKHPPPPNPTPQGSHHPIFIFNFVIDNKIKIL